MSGLQKTAIEAMQSVIDMINEGDFGIDDDFDAQALDDAIQENILDVVA